MGTGISQIDPSFFGAFALTPPGSAGGPWTYTEIYTFEQSGVAPAINGSLAIATGSAGRPILYGTSVGGGAGFGEVFSLMP